MSSKSWTVYIAECSDGSYYTGVTVDLIKRIKVHNSGKGAKYTRSRRPIKVKWGTVLSSRSEAQIYEYRIRKLSRKQKKLIILGLLDVDSVIGRI